MPIKTPQKTDETPDPVVNRIDVMEALKLRQVNKLTYKEIADRLGVTKQAVWERLQRVYKMIADPEEVDAYKKNRADLLAGAEMAFVSEALDPDKLKKASVNNLSYAMRQVYDIQRLETGQSTENVAYKDMSDDMADIDAELAEIHGKAKIKTQLPEYAQLEAELAGVEGVETDG